MKSLPSEGYGIYTVPRIRVDGFLISMKFHT